jgi:Leucine-rich repeat (LRR) protein
MIEHLGKLPNLKVVTLNHNKIRKIENLKNLRKLEVLNLAGNLIEDMSV